MSFPACCFQCARPYLGRRLKLQPGQPGSSDVPAGEALTYAVLYSKDNGMTWNAIGAGITQTSYAVDFATIPGSSSALIKVLASDGFHTASDVSDRPFTVPAKPPVPVIVSPPAGAQFKVGEQIKLQGYAVDLEEDMVSSGSLSWTSNLDGALGTGGAREVTLSEGTHTITLNAGGSGLQGIRYSTETPPVHWLDYTGPIQLPIWGSVTAFATDQAGNVEYPPAQVTVGHRVYLPLVIR